MSRAYEAVFFDMDGTFVNTEPHWLAAETELMAEFGHAWTIDDQRFCLGGPLSKVGKYMWELAHREHSPEWFHHELVARTIQHFSQRIEFMPGAHELFLALKAEGVPVALVTASPASLMNATLAVMDPPFFDVVISGDDVKVTKPDPEAYLLAAERLGVDITKSVVLEDSLTGIASAHAAGAHVFAIPHMVEVKEVPRQNILSTLSNMTPEDLERIYLDQNVESIN